MKKGRRIVVIVLLVIIILGYVSYKVYNSVDFDDKIAIIKIDGEIGVSSYFNDGLNIEEVINNLKDANSDTKIKGIILEINSPGGTVVASKEIADAVKLIQKPKVAYIREVGASGAYWIASASDVIVADPMSVTGSIGVIGSYLDFSGLLGEYNIKYQSLTAGKYKEAGSPYKNLTEDERKVLQSKINLIYKYFVDEVSKNRNMSLEQVKNLANGGIYLGIEAKENGLIDYLGDKNLAINITKQLANISEAKLITYEKEQTWLDVLKSFGAEASYNIGKGIGSNLIVNKELEIRV